MREDERQEGVVEPHGRSPRQLDTSNSQASLTEAIQHSLSPQQTVRVESESVAATLVGIPRLDVSEFVYSHQTRDGSQQPVALFDVRNRSDRPVRWQSNRTQFIGDDEYTYRPASLSLDPSKLGPGCHTRQVEIAPGRRARIVTLVEELPPNVDIVEVIHSLPRRTGAPGLERLVFSRG